MKKLINLIALVMLVSSNVLTPFSYAQVDIPELIPESGAETVEENHGEIGENPGISEKTPNSLGEVEGEGSLPLVREVVNESEPEGLKEEVEDSLDAVESPTIDEDKKEDPEKSESDEVVSPVEENAELEKQEEGNIGEEKENIETGDLLLKSLVDTELYAVDDPIECGSGYVLNADGTGCELIQVTFDANGGSFDGGEDIKTVDMIVNEVPPVRYSHTANINDDGVATSVYANNLSTNDVVTIPGATSLDIEVRFATQGSSYDWLAIYPAGIDPTASNYSSATISNGKLAGRGSYSSYTKPSNSDAIYHRNFTVAGDTAQFYFKSNGSTAYYGYYAIVKGIGAPSGNYECKYNISKPTRDGYVFQGWYIDEEFTQKFDLFQCFSRNMRAYAKWYKIQEKDIILEATATEANQTLKINKYFKNAYKVYRGDGDSENLTADTTHEYTTAGTYTVILSTTANRWTFQDVRKPLVPKNGTTMTGVKITYMPSLADGFGSNATNPGDYFFAYFNGYDSSQGAITSLPEGSFDTSNIKSVGKYFFSFFNENGALESLPEGSFDISNITSVGSSFFSSFNNNGKLTRLPIYSFRLSTGLTTAGSRFFQSFNKEGNLEQLPDESFNISSITKEGAGFFYEFNDGGKLIRLPEGSFDTSNITSAHLGFFNRFNANGNLESLPEGSFDISNISEQKFGVEAVGFFEGFNAGGALKSLPKNSFRLSPLLTGVYNEFFGDFNARGALEHLPEGSFDISNITSSYSNFFWYFNYSGALKSLPEGSFILSTGLTNVGYGFFYAFNDKGALESLPEGSFNVSNITSEGGSFFARFNSYGKLKELPRYSFGLSKGMTAAGSEFFAEFNKGGALKSLPEGSFDISNITSVKDGFFRRFNHSGDLTSLPEKSFNTSNITKIDYGGTYCYFFNSFNEGGALESLPEGSFDISNITKTTRHENFFDSFNKNGKLVNLPNSFKLNSAYANYGYEKAFNSPNYTLNKKVSDLLSGIATPTYDRNTFSDNQPGRCGVDANWLVTTADACSISYDDGLGGTGEFKYTADTTGVEVGSGMIEPIREGYSFSGWIDASGNNVEEIVFPEMDGQTLYANWTPNEYTITFIDGSGMGNDVIYTGAYESAVETQYPEWTKEGYTIHWDKSIPATMPLNGDTITARWTINEYSITFDVDGTLTIITGDYGSPITPPSNPTKNGYKFIGWEPKVPATIPAEDMTINAVWEKLGYSGGGGGGGSSKKTDKDTHGSAEDSQKNTQDDKNTENVIQSDPEHSEWGSEESSNTPMDSSDKSSEGQEILSPSDLPSSAGQVSFTKEQKDAYTFTKQNGITTKDTIQSAQMNGKLTRIAMAKMLSQYAINVLGQTPDTSKTIKFKDVTSKKDADYDNGVTLAYQLGIMGQNMPNNKFRPNDEVSRAEFATALSRLLYQTTDGEYKSTSKYYTPHMAKLYNEGIINNTDPGMRERRGYVMIMLMRSAK